MGLKVATGQQAGSDMRRLTLHLPAAPAPQNWLRVKLADGLRQTFRSLSCRRSARVQRTVTVKVLGVCVVFHISDVGNRRWAVMGDVKYSKPFWVVMLAWKTSDSTVVLWAQT